MPLREREQGLMLWVFDVWNVVADAGGVLVREGGVSYAGVVKPLRFLVDVFVNTFGITRPTPRQEAQAGWFIAVLLLLVAVFVVMVAWMLSGALSH